MRLEFIIYLFILSNYIIITQDFIKVAIVGAGIGGSSAAYYILKNKNFSVDIYERRDRVGGRVFSQKVMNQTENLGASFLLKENQVIFKMINDLNLSTQFAEEDSDGSIGIFNNKSILLTLGESDIINVIKVIWRYGIFAPLKSKAIITKHLEKFNKIYELLNKKNTSTSLYELLQKTENEYLITTTIGEYLKQNGVNAKYVDELYSAVIAGIYNQHQEVNSYAGFVALIGANNSPLNIVGGNDLLIKKIIESNQKSGRFNLFLNTSITEIVKNNSKFIVKDEFGSEKVYDYIIIACPLIKVNITFTNINIDHKNYYPYKFITPYLAFVKGIPRPEYFNWKNNDILPNTLISTDKHQGIVIQMAYFKEDVYRLVSEIELTEEMIEEKGYFNKGSKIIYRHHWNFAYPQFENFKENLKNLPEFILDQNMFYINAIEAAASCMELSMISARNIVNIIENEYNSK